MPISKVRPVMRLGGWLGYHRFYYAASTKAQVELTNRRTELVEIHRLLIKERMTNLLSEFRDKLDEFGP